MTTYKEVWDAMNDLDTLTSKLTYIKDMMEIATEYLDNNDKDRAKSLMYASLDYIKYYIDEYDGSFQNAWTKTIQAGKELDEVKVKLSKLETPNNPQYTEEEIEAMTNQQEHSSYYYDYNRNNLNRKNPFTVEK